MKTEFEIQQILEDAKRLHNKLSHFPCRDTHFDESWDLCADAVRLVELNKRLTDLKLEHSQVYESQLMITLREIGIRVAEIDRCYPNI